VPYPITESGGKFYVNGKGYDSKAEAEAYQRALYANAPDTEKAVAFDPTTQYLHGPGGIASMPGLGDDDDDDVKKSVGNTGSMIALFLPPEAAQALYDQVLPALLDAGIQEPVQPDDYHITLVYGGDAADVADQFRSLTEAIQELGDENVARNSLSGQVNGIGRFATSEDGETQPIYATFDAVDLPAFRHQIMALANSVGFGTAQNHGFIPHITLAYVPSDAPSPDIRLQPIDLIFDELTVAFGDTRWNYSLDGDAYEGSPMGKSTEGDDKASLSIIKQANGIYRWYSVSSNNIKDRDTETVALKMLQADVARTKMFGDDSETYFYHIPYPLGGAPDYRAIVDGMLVESGEFNDEPVAKAVATYINDHPEGLDGTGWGTSIGFQSMPDLSGTFYDGYIKERSVLPMSAAANEFTQFGVKNKMTITPEQQKALDTVLGDPTLVGVVQTALSAKEKSKAADEQGVIRKAKAVTPEPASPAQAAAAATQAQAQAAQVPVPVLKAGKNEATPMDALGFGKAQTHQKDAAAVQTAIAAEGQAAMAADDASDQLMAAVNATDAAVSAAIAEGRAAAALGGDPQAPAEAKAAAPAPVASTDPSVDAAQTQTPPAPAQKAGLSDEDMQGIAKFVNETVQKAVSDCMAQMKAEFKSVYGEVDKMRRTTDAQFQAKMLNEMPRSAYDRLKAFGLTLQGGITETLEMADGSTIKNPDYVEKGKNLPTAPEDLTVQSLLGFGN